MERDKFVYDEWARKYEGGPVPLADIAEHFNPTTMGYLNFYFRYDPVLKAVVHKITGKINNGHLMSLGAYLSPINPRRAEWMLRMGTDPWRVGTDKDGRLWAKLNEGDEKAYIEKG